MMCIQQTTKHNKKERERESLTHTQSSRFYNRPLRHAILLLFIITATPSSSSSYNYSPSLVSSSLCVLNDSAGDRIHTHTHTTSISFLLLCLLYQWLKKKKEKAIDTLPRRSTSSNRTAAPRGVDAEAVAVIL
jgi:hypothetical protein